MRSKLSTLVVCVAVSVGAACSGSEGSDGEQGARTVSAREYASGVCSAVASWVEDIQGSNEELVDNLDASSLDSVKNAMVGFLDDVIEATDSVIADVESVGVPDVDDGEASAGAVLTALRGSREIFDDARDRVDGLGTDDPTAFTQELQTLGTDLQTSLAGIGEELDGFDSPELDEASEDVPECDQVASAA